MAKTADCFDPYGEYDLPELSLEEAALNFQKALSERDALNSESVKKHNYSLDGGAQRRAEFAEHRIILEKAQIVLYRAAMQYKQGKTMRLTKALKLAKANYSIRREAWGRTLCARVYIAKLSADTEPCLVYVNEKNQDIPGWKPDLQDLLAKDWVVSTVGAP